MNMLYAVLAVKVLDLPSSRDISEYEYSRVWRPIFCKLEMVEDFALRQLLLLDSLWGGFL